MWLGHVPWAGRHWALPVLTVLAPSTRYYQQQGRQHKKLTDWARQMVMQLRRWLPHRPLVLVGDNSYAVLDLLHCCQSLREPVTLIACHRSHSRPSRPICSLAEGRAKPRPSRSPRLWTTSSRVHQIPGPSPQHPSPQSGTNPVSGVGPFRPLSALEMSRRA